MDNDPGWIHEERRWWHKYAAQPPALLAAASRLAQQQQQCALQFASCCCCCWSTELEAGEGGGCTQGSITLPPFTHSPLSSLLYENIVTQRVIQID